MQIQKEKFNAIVEAAKLKAASEPRWLRAIERAAEVHAVCSFRRTSLGRRLIQQAVHKASELRCGHLAVFYPDAQLADGAAEAETGGFFDIHNTPLLRSIK